MARKRKKRTPEEMAQEGEFRAQSDANLRRLRELVDRAGPILKSGGAARVLRPLSG